MSVWSVKEQSQAIFTGVNAGFDAVLGARGSKLQLVLNAIFNLESFAGKRGVVGLSQDIQSNLGPWNSRFPIAVGDNYLGYRLVGAPCRTCSPRWNTRPANITKVGPGENFFDPNRREAVVGSFVAQKLGLKRGRHLSPLSRPYL